MARLANPFRYIYRGGKPKTSLAVYRLWFGKRYLILKGKSLHQSVDNAAKQIDQQLRNGAKEDTYFYNAIGAIKKAHITVMEVEVICQPDTPAGLLLCEYSELQKAKGDENCLNASLDVYIPQWVPADDIVQFNQAVKSLTKKKRNNGSKKTDNVKKGAQRKGGIKGAGIHHGGRKKANAGAVDKPGGSVKEKRQASRRK